MKSTRHRRGRRLSSGRDGRVTPVVSHRPVTRSLTRQIVVDGIPVVFDVEEVTPNSTRGITLRADEEVGIRNLTTTNSNNTTTQMSTQQVQNPQLVLPSEVTTPSTQLHMIGADINNRIQRLEDFARSRLRDRFPPLAAIQPGTVNPSWGIAEWQYFNYNRRIERLEEVLNLLVQQNGSH